MNYFHNVIYYLYGNFCECRRTSKMLHCHQKSKGTPLLFSRKSSIFESCRNTFVFVAFILVISIINMLDERKRDQVMQDSFVTTCMQVIWFGITSIWILGSPVKLEVLLLGLRSRENIQSLQECSGWYSFGRLPQVKMNVNSTCLKSLLHSWITY